MVPQWEPPASQGRVIGGLMGVLVGEASPHASRGLRLSAPRPITAALLDVAHTYVAYRGEVVPVAAAERHKGVTGPGWLLSVALVRPDAPSRVSDTLELADAAGMPPRCLATCIAFVELVSRTLAGQAVDDIVHDMAPGWLPAADGGPRLGGDPVVDALTAAVWSLTRRLPLTDLVFRLRQTTPPDVAAAACGVLGTAYGCDAMPRQWHQRTPRTADCMALAPALMRARAIAGSRWPQLGEPYSRPPRFPTRAVTVAEPSPPLNDGTVRWAAPWVADVEGQTGGR